MSKIIYDTQWFIKKARKVHGNRYDYSKVDYKNNYTKVTIICQEHGEFQQTPYKHLRGNCCRKCSANERRSNSIIFIQKAIAIHGCKYDYSKVVYKKRSLKVIIICKDHGEFRQTPGNHLTGYGCQKCGYKSIAKNKTKSAKQFIKDARNIHGSRYDYSKASHTYRNRKTKVIIICKDHGEFRQTPGNHLKGHGCPCCARETQTGPGFDRSKDKELGYLYLIVGKLDEEYFCKIGTTNKTVDSRFSNSPFEIVDSLSLLISGTMQDMFGIEQEILDIFEDNRYIPKIKFIGHTECLDILSYQKIKKFLSKYTEHEHKK